MSGDSGNVFVARNVGFGRINIEFVAIDRSKKCLKSCIPSPRLGLQHCSGFVRQCVDAAFVYVWAALLSTFFLEEACWGPLLKEAKVQIPY